MLFDKVIAFDHVRQKIILMVNMSLTDPETSYNKAVLELEQLTELLKNGKKETRLTGKLFWELLPPCLTKKPSAAWLRKQSCTFGKETFSRIVLSNCFHAPFEGSLLQTYRILRTLNPSPYMFIFPVRNLEAAGASPETLVKLENGVLRTFPLAGTRPRGKNEEEDQKLEEQLLTDEKELAEHNMLVDLGRNDLGKISRFGTVQVERFHSSSAFPTSCISDLP